MSGTTLQGVVRLNDVLMLGPDSTGSFQPLPVKSIHRKRMPVREVRAGQTASFSLKKVKSFQNFEFSFSVLFVLYVFYSKLYPLPTLISYYNLLMNVALFSRDFFR